MTDTAQDASQILDLRQVKEAIDQLNGDPALLTEFDQAMSDLRARLPVRLNGPEFTMLIDHLVKQADETPDPLPPVSGLGF